MNPLTETVNDLMSEAIEFHVHFGPDGLSGRKNDAFELVRDAKSAGMCAVVLKNKSYGTGALAQMANKYGNGALAVGGITLDVSIGGLNPEAVEIEAAMGSKVVWMPTYSTLNDPTSKKTEKQRRRNHLTIVDFKGALLSEVVEILHIIKEYEMVLCTGHISRQETFALIESSVDMGLKKMVVNHPLAAVVGTGLQVEDQIALSRMGAFMEHCWVSTMPKPNSHLPVSDYVKAIRAVGADKCILATDFGQPHNPTPLQGFRMMLEILLREGMRVEELTYMVKVNPAELLGFTSQAGSSR